MIKLFEEMPNFQSSACILYSHFYSMHIAVQYLYFETGYAQYNTVMHYDHVKPMMQARSLLLSISRGAEQLVCLCATAAATLGRVRTSQAIDMICFLYRVISSSSKGAMSSSDRVLLLKSGGRGEFCFLLYQYVSTRAALYPGWDTKRRSPGIL